MHIKRVRTAPKKSRRSIDPDTIKKAAMTFRRWVLKPEQLPSNEKFGDHMITARFAAEILMKSKPDLIQIVEKMGSDEEGAQLLGSLLHDLELAEEIYGELAKMCGAVRARLYVARCAIEVADPKVARGGTARTVGGKAAEVV